MAEEIRLDLTLTGEQATTRGLRNVGESGEFAGGKLDGMAGSASKLDTKLDELRGSYLELMREFDRTGDIDLLKGIRANKRQIGQFQSIKDELQDAAASVAGDAAEAAGEAGISVGESLVKGISEGVEAGGPVAIAALVGIAVAAAPMIGGAIAAGVIGGVGIGGVVGGVAAAAQDQRVKTAAQDLGKNLLGAIGEAGQPMVRPVLDAIDVLNDEGVPLVKELGGAFAEAAPMVVPLTRGLTGLVRELLPGFKKGLEAAKPIVDVLGEELPELGEAFTHMLNAISEDPDGAVMALKAIFNLTEDLIENVGEFIGVLEKTYEASAHASLAIGEGLEAALGWVPLWGDYIRGANNDVRELTNEVEGGGRVWKMLGEGVAETGKATQEATRDLAAYNDALDDLFGRVMSLDDATSAYEKTLDELAVNLREGKRTLDITTEAGRENRDGIKELIREIKEVRDVNLANGRSLEYSNGLYDQQLESLRKNLLNLGYNRSEVELLISTYQRLPKDVEVNLKVNGTNQVDKVLALADLLGSKAAASGFLAGSSVSGRHSGGPVQPGQTYVVGENGPEVLQMGAAGGQVYNAGQTANMLSGASGGAAGPNLVAVVTAGDSAMQALLGLLDLRIELKFDNEVALAAGGPR